MRKTWVRRSLHAGALTAGALLVGGAAAQAGPAVDSSGNVGALSGTQALVPVQAPINLCGNAVAVLGTAVAGCEGGATALNPEWSFDHFQSTGNAGVGSGTQLFAPVQLPTNGCGNAVAVAGNAVAGCAGGAEAGHRPPEQGPPTYPPPKKKAQPAPTKIEYGPGGDPDPEGTAPPGTSLLSSGNAGLLAGAQVLAPVQAPVNICGNSIAVLGAAQSGCEGGATAR